MSIGLLGCSNQLKEAKKNADAGMYMYEDSQSLEGDDAVKAGLKWLFGILDETNLSEKQMDSELLDKRNNVFHLLTDKYMMTEEQIGDISGIKDDNKRNEKIDSIYIPIAIKLAEQQKVAEVKKLEARTQKLSDSEPQIGMTQQEVESSKWGKPKKINTTITKYGKSEQWVYDNYRYVYFDDGIVSSIQF
ncbi:hypothetical protein [Paenibacillus sp. SN-8-1]|uniref:hypothetical protein n=1 Tax=Paenibacillus sp. SN-8-1 TaxID=3435409 RepID=UPI003D9A77BF